MSSTSKPVDSSQPRTAAFTQRRLFLSCVSHEFRSYRDELAVNLAQPGVELRRQEDFVNSGLTTLEKLNDYIRTCDAVIHLVGYGTGAFPSPAEVSKFLTMLTDIVTRLGLGELLQPPGISYTQWEAWLAIYHGKPLALYRATENARREPGFTHDAKQRQRQQMHWNLLESLGRDRKEFVSPHDLSIEVLRAMPLLVPGFNENIQRGEFRDRNLLFAVFALQDAILSRGDFTKVCTLWAADTDQSIADIMRQEGLLTAEDQLLVEARIDRKLKAGMGNIRQSLAESLGSDVRNTLSESLDASTLASLPDRLSNLEGLSTNSDQWRYRLTRTHGSGGLGIVSIAEESALDRTVAVKQLRSERLLDPMAIERFVREARITGQLQHPNIVPVYELGLTPDDQVPFYAMRFVGHRTLQDVITQHYADKTASQSERNVRFREMVQSFLSVCNAIAFAHNQGVIHRDLKPANIMVGNFGEVILLDWGLAKRVDESEPLETAVSDDAAARSAAPIDMGQTQSGVKLGSPAYMAPEQAAGRIDLHGTRTDIYGLGVILYEILTGDVPFNGSTTEELLQAVQTRPTPNLRELNPSVHAALVAISRKAMEKKPEDRYATAEALSDDIQKWLADEPVSVFPEPIVMRMQRLARKNPGPVSALAAAVLVGVIGLIAGLYFVNAEKNQKELALQREEGLRIEAQRQEKRAVENSQLAARRFEEKRMALDDMLAAFSDSGLKSEPGSQLIRQKFLQEGIQQYQRMLADRAEDVPVLQQTADAYRELGMVNAELGEESASLKNLTKSVEMCRLAVAVENSPATRETLGDSLYELGQAYVSLTGFAGFAKAKPFATESREIFNSLHSELPDQPAYQAKLGRAMILVGLDSSGDWAEGSAAIELLRQAVATSPENAQYLSQLGRAINNFALSKHGDVVSDAVVDDYKEAARFQDQAIALQPTYVFAYYLRSLILRNAKIQLVKSNRIEEALSLIGGAIQSSRQFAEDNPAVPNAQVALAELLSERAAVLSNLERTPEAMAAYDETARIFEDLSRRYPGEPRYVSKQVQSLQSLATISAPTESLALLTRITAQSERAMRRHADSQELLGAFLIAFHQRGEKLRENQRLPEAIGQFHDGIHLFQEYSPRVTSLGEYERGRYMLLVQGLLEAYNAAENYEKAVESAAAFLAPISLDNFQDSNNQVNALTAYASLSTAFEMLNRVREAIDTRIFVRDEAKKLLGGNVRSNWYLYQKVLQSYETLPRLAALVGDEQREFASIRDYLSESDPYVYGHDHSDLLARTEQFTPAHLQELRAVFRLPTGVSGLTRKLKRFTLPTNDATGKSSLHLYVAETWDFLEDQFRWAESQGRRIPLETKSSFQRLFQIAKENNVSFQELCVYALGAAKDDETSNLRSPVIVAAKARSMADMVRLAQELNAARREVEANDQDSTLSISLIQRYAKVAQEEIGLANPLVAAYYLEEAEQLLVHAKQRFPTDVADLENDLRFLRGALACISGQFEPGYPDLLESFAVHRQTGESSADHKSLLPAGAIEFALGWCAARMDRTVEALTWYAAAADEKHPFSCQAIYQICDRYPQGESLLHPKLRSAWRLTRDSATARPKPPIFEDYYFTGKPIPDGTEFLDTLDQSPWTQTIVDSQIDQFVGPSDKFVVLLLFGKDDFGEPIYTYLAITFAGIERMKAAVLVGKGFNPTEFGTVMTAGRGEPSDAIRKKIQEKYYVITGDTTTTKSFSETNSKVAKSVEMAQQHRTAGIAFQVQGKFEEARQAFLAEAALLEQRFDQQAYDSATMRALAQVSHDVALLYAKTGDQKVSLEWIVKAAANGHADARFMLADSYDKGELLEKNPAKAQRLRFAGHYDRGRILFKENKYEEALIDLEKAHELDPANAACGQFLGVCYARLGNWEKATSVYLRALELTPAEDDSYLNFIEALLVAERPRELLDFLKAPAMQKWRTSVGEKRYGALLHGFEAIATTLLGGDATASAAEMRKYTDQPDFELSGWSWSVIDSWLSMTKIEEEKLVSVRGLLGDLKGKKEDDAGKETNSEDQ